MGVVASRAPLVKIFRYHHCLQGALDKLFNDVRDLWRLDKQQIKIVNWFNIKLNENN